MSRFAVTTFGCQMNQHDSERLGEVMIQGGHEPLRDETEADVIVLNTCSVREKAEQKLRSEVGRLAKLKRTRPELLLVVAGCMAQQEGKKILASMSAVDLVIGPDNIRELPGLLAQLRTGGPPMVRTQFDLDEPHFLTAPSLASSKVTAFVTTMKGCNERCSFCVVPYTRGSERYRASEEIVAEIRQLVQAGVREVTLLGQTVNSYRDPIGALSRAPDAEPDNPDESEFAALLWAIADRVPELERLRYTSPHPRHLTPSLITAHRDLSLLPRHVHLPVQSGSDRMLKRMIRRHTRAEYVERVARLRRLVPNVTISTDVIVGFCGETDEDFQQTLSLVDEIGFVGLFGFMYSPRPNTPALKMGDDVPKTVKSERLQQLFALSERKMGEHLRELLGSVQQVLVEGPNKIRSDQVSGRTARNEIVHIGDPGDVDMVGELLEVKIIETYKHSLLGELTADALEKLASRPKRTRRSLPLLASRGS